MGELKLTNAAGGGRIEGKIMECTPFPSLPGLTRQSKLAATRPNDTWITGSRRFASAR